ncbi:MAG: type II toxin-antitoxin system HicA family toxin [Leptolyngbyaceae bacterium]|nr:type II toxin-antitoxin system HicA family toxin [Leptolyngbyaceae bacterium]
MSRLRKLVNRFLSEPPEVRFDEVYFLLKAFGFEEKRSRGSHHIFRNSDGLKITVPKKGGKMVKRIYVKQIVQLLNLTEWNDESAD